MKSNWGLQKIITSIRIRHFSDLDSWAVRLYSHAEIFMRKFIEISLLIVMPLAWGLAVEFFFERLRRRRGEARNSSTHDDWVI
jgi:hypothetical protein